MISFRLVFRVVAILLLVVSAFMLVPIGWARWYGEAGTISAFLVTIGIAVVPALGFLLLTPKKENEVTTRDGFLMVSLSWLAASVVGALPFYLSGAIPSFADAFFETMSGFTTTGASILTDIEAMPRSLLFWRSLTHWLGGMGIIVLAVAIFPILGIGGLQLIKAEAPGPSVDKITPKITATAKILWLTYVMLSVAETVLLMFGGMDLFDALTHTFGTMATGGFSPRAASIGHYNSAYIDTIITIFMVLAGVNFVLYFKLASGRFQSLLRDTELKVYLSVFAGATVLSAIGLYGERFSAVGESVRYGAFQVASILTTTGYATDDFALWPTFPRAILFVLMFVGGCSGSTGGGIKVIRVVTLFKQGWNEMRFLVYPHGIFHIRLNRQVLKKNTVYAISGFVLLYIGILLITTLVVAAAGQDILTSLSTALVTLGNIGPGFGRIGPALNYAFYPSWIKVFLGFIMMMGRLEIYTVLVLFTARFWRQQ